MCIGHILLTFSKTLLFQKTKFVIKPLKVNQAVTRQKANIENYHQRLAESPFDLIIFTDHFNASWNEVRSFCKRMDSDLPIIADEDSEELIKRLLLGMINRKVKTGIHCTMINSMICMAYVGARYSTEKVGYNWLDKMVILIYWVSYHFSC